MKFEQFREMKSMDGYRLDVEESAIATITKSDNGVTKSGNPKYKFRYTIIFMYNGVKRKDNSKAFGSLPALKKSFIPLFNSRDKQTANQGLKVESNF